MCTTELTRKTATADKRIASHNDGREVMRHPSFVSEFAVQVVAGCPKVRCTGTIVNTAPSRVKPVRQKRVVCHMAATLDALITRSGTLGEARVDQADMATQMAALHPQCFGWAMACCGRRREDAEDVLHDVYAQVLDNGLRFDGRSTLKTWLFGVIGRTAQARLRRDRVRELLGARHATRIDRPAPAASPDDRALANDRRERTLKALAQLPRRQREVMLLVFYHDLTIEEAASVMRVSLGSARVHYQRGKQRLASLLTSERP
jgi:RNA polymerase sigma factor (sigma-70 family)